MNTHSTLLSVYQNPLYREPLQIGDIQLSPLDLLEHTLATGGTGSGKTRACVLPLVEQVMRRFGNDPDEKAGLFLIDAKGDMSRLATTCLRRAGREDEVFILGENGNCWFPIFEQFGGDPTQVANFLFEILEDRTSKGALNRGGSNDSFWEENARRLLRAGAILAKACHGSTLGGLSGINDAVNTILSLQNSNSDADDFDTYAKEVDHECLKCATEGLAAGRIHTVEHSDFLSYLKNDVCGGNPRTWSTIGNMTRNYLAQFSQPALRRIFEPDDSKTRIRPEDIIDRGALLIVCLSPTLYGESAAPFRMAIKKAFCQRLLQREHLCVMEGDAPRHINQLRPVLYVCDEFHTTLTAGSGGEAYFLDRAREYRCMCVLATQGISAILSVLGNTHLSDHLLNNCRTKFFFANDCPQTSEYFERLGGMEDRQVESLAYTPRLAPARFRLPNHTYAIPSAMRLDSKAISNNRQPRFSAAELGSMPCGSALVVAKGRELKRYRNNPADYANSIDVK